VRYSHGPLRPLGGADDHAADRMHASTFRCDYTTMAAPRVLILRAPGTNCDVETQYAFELAGAVTQRVHINLLLREPRRLEEFQVLCIPGGFSYGDDIAAGRILASRIEHHLTDALQHFQQRDTLLLGICNGFQVLLKSGLLLPPQHDEHGSPLPVATLTWNDTGRFYNGWVRLRPQGGRCVFFRGIEELELPVAHAEGKFVPRSVEILRHLEAAGQLALRYAPRRCAAPAADDPAACLPFPDNPNGSVANVAGVCDATGRVCGLMPHPERYVDPTQHPQWTRRMQLPEHGDGLAVFRNAVAYFR
jgi:phosphoribosylformylglycinamidine synthase I